MCRPGARHAADRRLSRTGKDFELPVAATPPAPRSTLESNAESEHDEEGNGDQMPELTIDAQDGRTPVYLATPTDAGGPWPGVVLIHDVFGMTRDLKHQADWLAEEGYLAVAPNLFSKGSKLNCVRSAFRELRSRRGPLFDEVDRTRLWIESRGDCNGTTGVIGFCMGGGFALLLANTGSYAASAVNYGQVPKDVDSITAGACPIVGSYGGRDRTLKGAAARLEKSLDSSGIPNDIKEYPDAGHGFLNDHSGRLSPMLRFMGGGYHPESAKDARARIISFFDSHLR